MGAWGTAIFSDDLADDIRSTFREVMEELNDERKATALLLERYREELNDPDDACVFWLALASLQWKAGRLMDEVKEKALRIIAEGTDLERWEFASEVKQRRSVLDKLAAQLQSEQPPAKQFRKRVPRPRRYRTGDIFLVPFDDGTFGAGVVLRVSAPSFFGEYYLLEPFPEPGAYRADMLTTPLPTVQTWCIDVYLQNKTWPIVDHRDIGERPMPMAWRTDTRGDYYLYQLGEEPFKDTMVRKATKEEVSGVYPLVGHADPYGVTRHYETLLRYKLRQRKEQE